MRVHIGTDHAGFDLKRFLVAALTEDGHDVVDHGPHDYDPEDDYPVYCIPRPRRWWPIRAHWASWSAAPATGSRSPRTRWPDVRAALAYDDDTAKLGRQHNDANVISIGGRMHTEEEALELVRVFLATPFSGEERHARRIRLLAEYEASRG